MSGFVTDKNNCNGNLLKGENYTSDYSWLEREKRSMGNLRKNDFGHLKKTVYMQSVVPGENRSQNRHYKESSFRGPLGNDWAEQSSSYNGPKTSWHKGAFGKGKRGAGSKKGASDSGLKHIKNREGNV